MANTIPAALIPVLYASAATVAREQIGFIPAVDQRFNEKNLKVGQTLTIPISDKDFTVLEGIHGARIHIEIRIELLHRDADTAGN